jgi:glycosyltransferase involved in cell wall biosynthesis
MNIPTVAVTGIFKNEADHLDKCLSSVFDFADEFVLGVDDASTDQTEDICKKWVKLKGKGKVVKFTWESDFSAARNKVRDEVQSDWWFTVDGHEYLEPDHAANLCNIWNVLETHPNITAFSFFVQLEEVDGCTRAFQFRLMKNDPEIRYDRPLHNQVIGIYGKDKELVQVSDIEIIHVRSSRNRSERDGQREEMVNTIFLPRVQENKDDHQAWFYLGAHYHVKQNYEEAEKCYREYLRCSNVHYEIAKVRCQLSEVMGVQARWAERKELLQEGLKTCIDMPELWIHLGETYEHLGEMEQALFCFNSAAGLSIPSSGIFMPRSFGGQEPNGWIPHLKRAAALERMGRLDEAHAAAQIALTKKPIPHDKEEMLKGALTQWQVNMQKHVTKKIEEGTEDIPRIAVFDRIGSFTKDIIKHWKDKGHNVEVSSQIEPSLALWSTHVWFEWCDENAVAAPRLLWDTKKKVCRLHGYEAYTPYPSQLNPDIIDNLIFVSEHHQAYTLKNHTIWIPSSVISNGVDLKKFKYRKREVETPRIAYVGYIHTKKGAPFIIELAKMYKEYEFHIIGKFQEMEMYVKRYFEHHLDNLPNIKYYGWVEPEVLPDLLDTMTHVLSTSITESFGYSILEGMAMGLKPILNTRPGTDGKHSLWPEECVFKDFRDFRRVTFTDYNPERYRQWAEKFSLEKQLSEIDSLMGL